MRKVEIILDKLAYLPGETISGTLSVVTDKNFNANCVLVSLNGEAFAEVSEGTGEDETTYSERQTVIDQTIRLKEKGMISKGVTKFPFEFQLPDGIPGSYNGTNGMISYSINGKIEISWRLDPRATQVIKIMQPIQRLAPYSYESRITFDEENEIIIQMDSDLLTPGEPVVVRYRVNGRPKIRGLRFDIVLRETVRPEGEEETFSSVKSTGFFALEDIPPETWMQAEAKTEISWPTTPQSQLIQAQYFVEVTADIPFRFDKTASIPLRIGRPIES
ncbi:MAG: sporulation protein [Candidatus Thorarchaeota archaeon]|nr:sporulation protein [Candidatus Thorarchaeota archaeon]